MVQVQRDTLTANGAVTTVPTRNVPDPSCCNVAGALCPDCQAKVGRQRISNSDGNDAVGHSERWAVESILSEDEPGALADTASAALAAARSGDGAKAARLHRKAARLHEQAADEAEAVRPGDPGDGTAARRHRSLAKSHLRAAAMHDVADTDQDDDEDGDEPTDNFLLVPPSLCDAFADARAYALAVNEKAGGSNADLIGDGTSDQAGGEEDQRLMRRGVLQPAHHGMDQYTDAPPVGSASELFGRGMPVDEMTRINRQRQGLPEDADDTLGPPRTIAQVIEGLGQRDRETKGWTGSSAVGEASDYLPTLGKEPPPARNARRQIAPGMSRPTANKRAPGDSFELPATPLF